jgi:hypothetical protein
MRLFWRLFWGIDYSLWFERRHGFRISQDLFNGHVRETFPVHTGESPPGIPVPLP